MRRLNLDAPWYLTQQVAKRWMIANGGGRIISVVLCPTRGIPGMVHSSAARSATEALARVLSVEWGKYGIGVVCVAPGWIDTEGMRQYGDDLGEMARYVPMGRLGTAEEVGRHDRLPGLAAGPLHHRHHDRDRRRHREHARLVAGHHRRP